MKVLNNITLKLLFLAINWTFQGMAQAQSEKYVRTYQTAVILNNSVPFDDLSEQTALKGESDLKKAVSWNDHTLYQADEYGLRVLIPPGCINCRVEVAVYDSAIFENKSNDFIGHEGLIYGIYAESQQGTSTLWQRKSFGVDNCLYGNLGHLDKSNIVDADGDLFCPNYTRPSDEWRQGYYVSAMEWLKLKHPNDEFRRPFALEKLPVILRVTIIEGTLGGDFAIKNDNFIDSYIPGIGKVTDYFNFDEPQKREPIITTQKTGQDGTVSAEHGFIDDTDPTEFIDNPANSSKPTDETDFKPGVDFYPPGLDDCGKTNWPKEDVYQWTAKYETNTSYENEVIFYVRKSDVKVLPYTQGNINKPTLFDLGNGDKNWDNIVYNYALSLGRIPRILRRGVENIYFNAKTDYTADGCPAASKAIRFGLLYEHKEFPEALLHEAVHTTFDEFLVNFPGDPAHNGDAIWGKAIKADGRNYSEYVQQSNSNMLQEQVSEHFAVFLWLRTNYFKNRKFPNLHPQDPAKAEREAKIFRNQVIDFMQNRIYYFENHLLGRPYNGITYATLQDAIHPLNDQGKIFNSSSFRRADHSNESSFVENENPGEKFSTLIFPNPTSGDFTVRMNTRDAGNYEGYFYNSSGKIIQRLTWELQDGGTHDLPFHGLEKYGLQNGLYFIAILGPEGKIVMPVMIQD